VGLAGKSLLIVNGIERYRTDRPEEDGIVAFSPGSGSDRDCVGRTTLVRGRERTGDFAGRTIDGQACGKSSGAKCHAGTGGIRGIDSETNVVSRDVDLIAGRCEAEERDKPGEGLIGSLTAHGCGHGGGVRTA